VRIDLNADVGEASTADGKSAEIALLSSVTSVNIACGAHAGDLGTMHELVAAAAAAGLAIGAHPGYADRDGMGRREQHLATSEIATLVREQVNLLTSVARAGAATTVESLAALDRLCRQYWQPLYYFACSVESGDVYELCLNAHELTWRLTSVMLDG